MKRITKGAGGGASGMQRKNQDIGQVRNSRKKSKKVEKGVINHLYFCLNFRENEDYQMLLD